MRWNNSKRLGSTRIHLEQLSLMLVKDNEMFSNNYSNNHEWKAHKEGSWRKKTQSMRWNNSKRLDSTRIHLEQLSLMLVKDNERFCDKFQLYDCIYFEILIS